jgi:hypothetical protein
MSLKRLTAASVLALCSFLKHAMAQENELSGLIGRTFISDQDMKGGTDPGVRSV